MTAAAEDFTACIARGGVVLFGADTVYGLAAAPDSDAAVRRLYELKGRSPAQPAAVMFFGVAAAREGLGDLGPRTGAALDALLPGPVTLLLPNPSRRWPLACGPDPDTLGIRVPDLPLLAGVPVPVLQSSANLHGGADAGRLADVDPSIRSGADLEIDAGDLPGTPSTVIDLRGFEADGSHAIVREGAVNSACVQELLRSA